MILASVSSNRSSRLLLGTGVMLLLVVGAGLTFWKLGRLRLAEKPANGDAGQAQIDAESPGLAVLVSGDTAGWMVPCGCAAGQSGGLLRRGSLVADERQRQATIVVDAGGAPGGTALYDKLKFTAILNGELKMGLKAHNIGGPEAALGLEELRRLEQVLKFPFISANLKDLKGQPLFEPCKFVEANGRRLMFIGVLSQRFAGSKWQIDEPRESILATLEKYKGQFDWAIVLAYLPEVELRELAATLPEVHAVVGGPTGQSIAPLAVGPVLLASATNKGKFVVRLSVPAPRDTTPWEGHSIELTSRFADDLDQSDILTEFRRHLDERDLTASDSGLVADFGAKRPPEYQIAGSGECRECHQQDADHWKESSHSKAWETLVHRDAHVDSYCQQCHTTGFGLPGGFQSVRTTPARISVGCESCHGPSQAHVQRPTVKTPFAAKDQCVRCHDHENSPQFDYAKYWLKIKHGTEKAKQK
ncbi:MAG: cycA1 [Planctomycetaceae bacterium]|nr:cycA1 [Planctomycetaceae bacterium]